MFFDCSAILVPNYVDHIIIALYLVQSLVNSYTSLGVCSQPPIRQT